MFKDFKRFHLVLSVNRGIVNEYDRIGCFFVYGNVIVSVFSASFIVMMGSYAGKGPCFAVINSGTPNTAIEPDVINSGELEMDLLDVSLGLGMPSKTLLGIAEVKLIFSEVVAVVAVVVMVAGEDVALSNEGFLVVCSVSSKELEDIF
ncbi:hypothetical protein WICPIJ_003783 [Wickerhamomyces pijperi]|uniref:Uncharacterized protein n=1 Tax=Wickerhamomyces pijperi TaxID=599730 RepID=A0A9P8Q986_WICPI|nr:hypothetical protein WICPIJ_003783 [Wickerhamomyces pijperi]